MNEMFFDLAKYRLQRAFESKGDARILLKGEQVYESVNRVFQANYYAVKSLLAMKMKDSSKHQKVMHIFHEDFVQSGEVPGEYGTIVERSYRSRGQEEHRDQFKISDREAESMIEECERFLCFVREYLQQLIISNPRKSVDSVSSEGECGGNGGGGKGRRRKRRR